MTKKIIQKKNDNKHHMLIIGIGSVLLFLAGIVTASFFPKRLTYLPPQRDGLQKSSALDKAWTWQETTLADGQSIQPAKKDAFTITFRPDNKLSITTDCNSGTSSYSLDANSIAIAEFATTLMYCENSQEEVFIKQILEADTYLIDQETLYILLPMDSGTMTFAALKTDVQ